jgi:hypothetical protein
MKTVSETPITRRDALKQSALMAMVLAGVAKGEPRRTNPASADWPMSNGPDGNFNPRRYGHALVDDLSRARLLWKSEDNDIGFAKGSASGYLALLVKRPAHPVRAQGQSSPRATCFAVRSIPLEWSGPRTSHISRTSSSPTRAKTSKS